MTTEFRILGEVEAFVDGRPVEVGHARQRCVLVCLLVDVNRPVSPEQLIDRIWAEEPPQKARNALAAYISRLRRLFVSDDVEIVRGPAGYLLRADPLSIDLHRFQHLVSAARTCANPGEATALFDQALGLWRGTPFELIDAPWANGVRETLELDRLSVMLDRNDAALDTGRHSEVLAELTTALEEHPLDERMAGQLMLAQYRSGRQADALDTYRAMRERLVEQLGVEPSPSLRAVHQQILDGDPGEPVPPERRSPPAVGPAPELPRRASSFVGRQAEVARVCAAIHDGAMVTLTGVGGVGKTRLALEAADRERERFRDGAWICELAPLDDGRAVSQAAAVALRLQPRDGLDFDEMVIEHLRTRELLLVVDNCEHLLDDAAALIDRISRYCPRVSVLATSRAALAIEGEQVIPVEPLAESDAIALFADRAKASRGDFALEHQPVGAVAEICRRLDGLPLAIELAAARMRAMSSLDMARRLDRLRLLSGGSRGTHPRQHSVTATIDWSYRLLSAEEQSLFERLCVFAGGFDLDAAHGVCADSGDADDTMDLLAGLVDKSMVVVRADAATTRYDILQTLRAYGRDRLREKGIHDRLAARHATYFTEFLECATAGQHGAEERWWVERLTPDARTTFTAPDYDNLRAAFDRSIAAGEIGLALRLITAMPESIHLRIGYHSIEWAERAVEVADPDHALFVAAVGVAARGRWVLGEFARARRLAKLAQGCRPSPGSSFVAYPDDTLADVRLYEGDVAFALAHYEREAELARRDADSFRLVWTLYNVTICHDALDAPEAGVHAAQEATRVADATANPSAQAMARCALGRALKVSDPDRALNLLDEAAAVAAAVQNNWLTGIARTEVAAVRAACDAPAAAARLFLEAFDHWDHGGPGTGALHWLTLHYVTRFLARVGAHADAITLHGAIAAADRRPPLDIATAAETSAAEPKTLGGAEAVALARSVLQRYC
ncbi:AfsR family transcriptional regulator [Mycolicibacterium elephantis]|uniref:AfsR family transcriptional regulator n=1 Tax=Mycolicibacterium elephantis TaxID=81858 RepID=A0A1X0D7P6_9MYCO|nr:BTAD domain-containing putative transcriptional regulator [Mycolicibacterium elephantis]OBE99352.1 transcriptional regulator [Mycolicibacterium elephantis]ORA68367.1 AfsR family transcriptional regulator [Mycolicibacterium elephantis]